MKRLIPLVSLSIIFGAFVSFLEYITPAFRFPILNMLDIKLFVLLLSLFIVLLFIHLSTHVLTGILSLLLYVITYFAVSFYYLKLPFGYELYIRLGIIIVSGFLVIAFLHAGRNMMRGFDRKTQVRGDVAIPIILFLFSILFDMAVVLFQQKLLYSNVISIFYSYLYFLIAFNLILSFLSFNEISGFFIGFLSFPVYFLMQKLLSNNFNFLSVFNMEKTFLIVIAIYSLLFGMSTAFVGHSTALFLKGIRFRKLKNTTSKASNIPETVSVSKNIAADKKQNSLVLKESKPDATTKFEKPLEKDVDKNSDSNNTSGT